jgi:hypothetical protein
MLVQMMIYYSYRDVRVQSFGLTCQDRCLVRSLSTSIMSILTHVILSGLGEYRSDRCGVLLWSPRLSIGFFD